jgi:large subunit ribosomal protein L24
MKQFSKHWRASRLPRKQHKFQAQAPLHIKRKFMASTLSKELRKKYGRRNIELRKGDEIKVMRGQFEGKQGKVEKVDVKNTRITIDGIQNTRKDGTKISKWFNPSKVKIINLNLDDKRRLKIVEKKEAKEKNAPEKK